MGGGILMGRLASMITVAFSQLSSPVHSEPVCSALDLGFASPSAEGYLVPPVLHSQK
jgi:hypothetical protein